MRLISFAVQIAATPQLLPWPRWKAELGERMMPGFDGHGDPKNWGKFKGTVPARWFTHVVPNPASHHLKLGYDLKDSGRLEDAIAELYQTLRLAPCDPAARQELSCVGRREDVASR